MKLLHTFFLALTAIAFATGILFGADDDEPAITNIADAGADFAFVGDYSGRVNLSGCQTMGLQVAALGKGKFTGMAYLGGLPGNGWNQTDREKVNGELKGNTLQLTMDKSNRSIDIVTVWARVTSSDGIYLGRLRKYNRRSTTLGLAPPRCAKVLFDGTDTSNFKNGKISPEGYLEVGAETTETYRDFLLHLEYRIPYLPRKRSQSRGNSGVYINSRYEVQILDSFGLEGKPNECGGLYSFKAPDENMVFPPLAWQTYDIRFRSPQFDADGKKIRNACITVRHNNVLIHKHVELPNKTGAGRKEGPNGLPTKLQAHGSPVHYRNIWILDYERTVR